MAVDACRPIMGMQNYDSLSRQATAFIYFVAIGMSNIYSGRLNTYVKEEGIEYVSVGSFGKGDNANVHCAVGGCNNLDQWWPIHGDKYSELVDKHGQVMCMKTTVLDGMAALLGIQVSASECKKTSNDGMRILGVRALPQLRHGDTLIMVMSRSDEISVTIGDVKNQTTLKAQEEEGNEDSWIHKTMPTLVGKTRVTGCKFSYSKPTKGKMSVVKLNPESTVQQDEAKEQIKAVEEKFANDLRDHKKALRDLDELHRQAEAKWKEDCDQIRTAAREAKSEARGRARGGRKRRVSPVPDKDLNLPPPPAKRPRPRTPKKGILPVVPDAVYQLEQVQAVRLSLAWSESKPRLPCSEFKPCLPCSEFKPRVGDVMSPPHCIMQPSIVCSQIPSVS